MFELASFPKLSLHALASNETGSGGGGACDGVEGGRADGGGGGGEGGRGGGADGNFARKENSLDREWEGATPAAAASSHTQSGQRRPRVLGGGMLDAGPGALRPC